MAVQSTPKNDYYTEDVDFAKLADEHEAFGALWRKSKAVLDWQDPASVQFVNLNIVSLSLTMIRLLTKALLQRDFGIKLSLPDDRLCPPVPVRFNYIRWIQQLVDSTSSDLSEDYDEERTVVGLDIGVGASCIYALLACATRPQYRMLGTDIDIHSLQYANMNIEANDMTDRIRVRQTSPADPLIPTALNSIDFLVCNPPFYSSDEDMKKAASNKALPPSAICTGSTSEMICPGGDLGFASRILNESVQRRDQVQWYSCMLARLASAESLVAKLKEYGITNFAATNLRAGHKTVRWVVAWSFADYRPKNDVARHGKLSLALLPPATERTIELPDMLQGGIGQRLDEIMSKLALEWTYSKGSLTGVAQSVGVVWSRSARRQIARGSDQMETESAAITFAVRLTCEDGNIHVRWLRGNDTLVLESFVGMLRRALGLRRN